MGFETPAFLWATLAALIPVLLHLIARRRAQVHDFAAIEFILGSNKRIARRLKVRQWLLMAARMLLIGGLAFAFAKPYRITSEQGLPATTAPTSVVLVIDSSFSMGIAHDGESLLERAKERALAILGELRNESDIAIVDAGYPARALTPRLSFDRQITKTVINNIEQHTGRADMQAGLRLAEQMLSGSTKLRREVVILTDLQASEWADLIQPWSLERAPEITVVDVRDGTQSWNLAITDVTVEPGSTPNAHAVHVTVSVLNDSPRRVDGVVTVRIGDKAAKGVLKMEAHQTTRKEFTIQLPEGAPNHGIAEISADLLPEDNRFSFVVQSQRQTQVLIINGAARSVPYLDETFFLRAALQPDSDAHTRINTSTVKPDEFTPAQLIYVDTVILANVAELDEPQSQALLRWVRSGGGLLLTAGDNTAKDGAKDTLRSLYPLPVRGIRSVRERPVFWTSVDGSHPALSPFAALSSASLYSAETHQYVLLDTAPWPETSVLSRFTDGAPALVERRLDDGVLMMLTTSIDRDWNSLPFKTSYLPLVQQLVLYLAGRLESPRPHSIHVDEVRTVPLERDVDSVQIHTPDNRTVRIDAADMPRGEIRFQGTKVPGLYTVTQGPKHNTSELFTVHIDPMESKVTAAQQTTIERLLDTIEGDQVSSSTHATPHENHGRRGNMWPAMLIALFGLLGVEAWLALG
jgi:hypothetical protein